MVFLQLTVNFKWTHRWRKGDVQTAFLQGKKRDTDTLGKLYLRQPKSRRLPGVPEGCLLEVLRSVYGLPDAPRAWWEEFTGFLLSLGFTHSRIDVAFLTSMHVLDLELARQVPTKYPQQFGKAFNSYLC